ncbi:MAG: hypothetical protein KDI06_19885 [Calditrichaeota bacterium]|nr:hypothetical protein [Calditrichota bacterium]HQU74754.1 hypothetical protein [Calditrichia bacterium]
MDKQTFVNQLETRVEQLDTKIDALMQEARKKSDELSTEARQQVDRLKEKRSAFNEELQGFKVKSGNALQEAKSGLEKTWEELRKTVDNTIAEINH